MGAIIRSGARVVFTGDSNTASLFWYRPGLSTAFDPASIELPTGFVKSVNSVLQAPRPARQSVQRGRRASNAGRLSELQDSTGAPIVEINTGVNGSMIADVVNNFTARVSSQNPDVVIPFIGLNNCGPPLVYGPQGATTPGNPGGDISALASLLAALGKPVIWPGIVSVGSQWTAGPPVAWANNPTADANIDTVNSLIQATCSANGFFYVDQRTPLLAYLATNNTPAPGWQTFLTYDTLHLRPLAADLMGQYCYAQCTVIP